MRPRKGLWRGGTRPASAGGMRVHTREAVLGRGEGGGQGIAPGGGPSAQRSTTRKLRASGASRGGVLRWGGGVSVRGHWWRAALGGSWQGGTEVLSRHRGGWSGHPQPPRLVSAAAPVSLFLEAGPSGRGCCPSGNQPVLGLCVTGALQGGRWGVRPSPSLQSHFCPAGDGGAAPWWRTPRRLPGVDTARRAHVAAISSHAPAQTRAFAWLGGWVQPAAPSQLVARRRRRPAPVAPARPRAFGGGGARGVWVACTGAQGVCRSAAAVCAALCSRHWRRLHRSAAAWTGAEAPRSWSALRAGADTVRLTCVAAGVLGWCGENLRKLCPPSLSTTTRRRRRRRLLGHLQVAPSLQSPFFFVPVSEVG